MTAREVYDGSDGALTIKYLRALGKRGPIGLVAMNLFRAQKNSARAKKYHGGNGSSSYRGLAYERKTWAMGNLCEALHAHAEGLGIVWGWARDPKQDYIPWVLYIELPGFEPGFSQVSFHATQRGAGPDYPKGWDGKIASELRVIKFCDQVLAMAIPDQAVLEAL